MLVWRSYTHFEKDTCCCRLLTLPSTADNVHELPFTVELLIKLVELPIVGLSSVVFPPMLVEQFSLFIRWSSFKYRDKFGLVVSVVTHLLKRRKIVYAAGYDLITYI